MYTKVFECLNEYDVEFLAQTNLPRKECAIDPLSTPSLTILITMVIIKLKQIFWQFKKTL